MLMYQSENSFRSDHLQLDVYTDYNFPRHLHQDLEFVLMLEGRTILTINEREEPMSVGKLALVLPNQIHAFRTETHSRMLVCPFSGNYVRDFLRQLDEQEGMTCVFDCPESLNDYLQYTYLGNDLPSRLSLKATLYAICDQYMKNVTLIPKCRQDDDLLFRMLTYIEQKYQNDISLHNIAADFGYNENYLSRVFSASIGIGFRHYLNRFRVDQACRLICDQKLSMSEIAMESGFQSIRSFNRCFVEQTGISPNAYLRKKFETKS